MATIGVGKLLDWWVHNQLQKLKKKKGGDECIWPKQTIFDVDFDMLEVYLYIFKVSPFLKKK